MAVPPGYETSTRRRRALAAVAGRIAFAVVLAGAMAVAAGSAGAAASTRAAATGTLRWRQCGDADCATLTVPLDEVHPDTRTIDLALVRIPARDPSRRIGSLLLNPGGPGASGVSFARGIAGSLPSDIQDRFDIVGFDPRGVGKSSPVRCDDNLDSYYALDFAPETDAERTALIAGVQKLVDSCEARSGPLLPYLASEYTARDMDRIRAALGDAKLTYVGFSYGTYLGALYAHDFPDRVRALVLDGAVDPALSASDQQVQQAVGFEQSLDQFLRFCASDPSCAFHRDGRSADAYDALRARVESQPIAGRGRDRGRALGPTEFDIAVTQALYAGKPAWSTLAEALDGADRGDPTAMLDLSDAYTERRSDGTYDDIDSAFFAIGCPDGPPMGGLEGVRAIEERAQAVAPRLGRSIVNNSLACALWPVQPTAPAAPIHAPGAPPIVVIGTRHDPATPLRWAKGLARELGHGVLMTARGSRHTAFAAGNSCIDNRVVHYLVDLKPPKNDTAC
ncbi:MAG TPA: alpha/beta hydrolase [Acidimicrobiia bacterium]|nr:alpha/beta hydrolase [Acidimicrobiia bacterium]